MQQGCVFDPLAVCRTRNRASRLKNIFLRHVQTQPCALGFKHHPQGWRPAGLTPHEGRYLTELESQSKGPNEKKDRQQKTCSDSLGLRADFVPDRGWVVVWFIRRRTPGTCEDCRRVFVCL